MLGFPTFTNLSHKASSMRRRLSGDPPGITLTTLQSHNTSENAWVAIDGVVYDVTLYHKSHPGGDLLLSSAGRDVSAEFHLIHKQASRSVLHKLPCAGKLTIGLDSNLLQQQQRKKDEEDGYRKTFAAWATSRLLPCVGAKIAMSRQTWDVCICDWPLGSCKNPEAIAKRLKAWHTQQKVEWGHRNFFTTFVAVFPATPPQESDLDFEINMFSELGGLMRVDNGPWPQDMPRDVKDPGYYYSVFGVSYFVVGLHPSSCRPGRRFQCAALVFNTKHQFDQLHKTTEFQDLQSAIRKRDTLLSGAPNPSIVADLPVIQQCSGYDHTRDRIDWFPDL